MAATFGIFSKCVWDLLKLGNTLHISLHSLEKYGLPQDRKVLVLVAAQCPALCEAIFRPVEANTLGSELVSRSKVGDLIRDLEFINPRTALNPSAGRVYLAPVQGRENSSRPKIYDHITGLTGEAESIEIDVNADTVSVSKDSRALVHPVRNDLLTVRELARIQGFDDEFRFHGQYETQLSDVLGAQPPALSIAIAKSIQDVVKAATKRDLGTIGENTQGHKRKRSKVE
ncbi:hypothetical protein BX600DRAFT_524517 [Xylariales sp. PMI_506]|nr:hypothetical protein BX600DRAFT_524517 [Xylariales sp. PMI_506]